MRGLSPLKRSLVGHAEGHAWGQLDWRPRAEWCLCWWRRLERCLRWSRRAQLRANVVQAATRLAGGNLALAIDRVWRQPDVAIGALEDNIHRSDYSQVWSEQVEFV